MIDKIIYSMLRENSRETSNPDFIFAVLSSTLDERFCSVFGIRTEEVIPYFRLSLEEFGQLEEIVFPEEVKEQVIRLKENKNTLEIAKTLQSLVLSIEDRNE